MDNFAQLIEDGYKEALDAWIERDLPEVIEKAVKMAGKMDLPILGIVENMSYFVCPNCSAKHYSYGESHIDEIAEKSHTELSGE